MSIQYSESTKKALERLATAPRTSEQGRGGEYQRGRDDQLRDCCDALRDRFRGIGRARSNGLADWLYAYCRPRQRPDLRDQLLTLLDGCVDAPETEDLRRRVEALPRGLTVGTTRQEDIDG